MARVDSTLKKQAEANISDYVKWLLGKEVRVLRKLGGELPATKRADLVFQVADIDNRPFVFHLEFQQDLPKMPMNLRMLGYSVRLLEKYQIPVCGTVIYLKPSADAGHNSQFVSFCPIKRQKQVLTFYYDEIKLWKIDAKKLLKQELIGIYPLLSLANLGEPEEDTLRQIVNEIKKIHDRFLSQDTLFAFKLLGSIKHSKEILDALIRREDIMESPLAREIYEEGMNEGIQKGTQNGIRTSILEILNNRFGFTYKIGKEIEDYLSLIRDTSTLQELLLETVNAKNLESFIATLEQNI